MAATRIEIEHSGYGWSAELDAHGRAFPRLTDATLDGLFAQIRVKMAEVNAAAQHKPRVEAGPSVPAPRMAMLASRRSLARMRREIREALAAAAQPIPPTT